MTKPLATFLLAALPLAVFAHTGHGEHGFLDAFTHSLPAILLVLLPALLLVGAWIRRSARTPE